MIRTAFDLPFSVTHPTRAFFSSGQNVTVVVRLRDDVPPDAADRISAAMKPFVDLAGCEGLLHESADLARRVVRSHCVISIEPTVGMRAGQHSGMRHGTERVRISR